MGLLWWKCSSLAVGILLLLGSCLSEKAPYSTFAKDATLAPPILYYDYIIIGGGTSGCALAATLSQNSKILLLERGNVPYGDPNINNVGGFQGSLFDISPTSPSQLFISTDGVINHRARVLGGGSALNAGFYSRASTGYVRNVGWEEELVHESYEWVEKKVAFEPGMLRWQTAVRDGLLEAGVVPDHGFTYDHLVGTKFGGTIFDEQGKRHTAADLLEYADPNRITVYLHATVHQILFAVKGTPRPRAYGVMFKDKKGNKHIAYLNKGSSNEIILSAGALGSPQLLMLSGIGPVRHLQAHHINVLMDQPNVGQGMSDNPMNALVIPSPLPVETSLIQAVGITEFGSYIEAASGSIEGFLSNSLKGLSMSPRNPISAFINLSSTPVGMIVEKVTGPFSTGHLELQTLDPKDNPKVTFNYFKDPRDLQICVKGMETIIKVIESNSFSSFRYPLVSVQSLLELMLAIPANVRPKHFSSAFSLEQFCIDTVMTIWHYHGGCQVGKVVDKDYRVFGVDGLRVVDGSTFYSSPGTNPQATVMMLGRYMGQKILRERIPN